MIRLIAAMDRKRGIAKYGFQPWYIPEDEAYFTEMTRSHGGIVLVGSTTFKTFAGPLKGRSNFVLTTDKTPIEGVELVRDLKKFFKEYRENDIWVIGGANVFTQVLDLGVADELYLTQILADFGCHQFFPEFEDDFHLSNESELHEENGFIFSFNVYVK